MGYKTLAGNSPNGSVSPGFSDSFKISLLLADVSAAPNDIASFLLRVAQNDTNALQTEILKLTFPSPSFGDSNIAPSETKNFLLRFWLTGSAGTGTTNPSNANGSNNGILATLTTVAAGTNPIVMTSVLGANIPSGLTISTAVYRGWFKSVNNLATSTGSITMRSTSALFADIIMFSNVALNTTIDNTVTPFSFNLITAGINTLAKLQSCQVLHKTNDAAAGVTPHILTVDAGTIELNSVFT